MPQPSQRDVHAVDAILTNISVAYIQQLIHFIAGRVFPNIPVEKKTDKYYVYTKADWFRDEAQRRGDSAESAGSGYNLSTAGYDCDVWAMHKDVGDLVLANSDIPLDPFADAARWVSQRLMLRREIQWVTDFFVSTAWDTSKTGTTDFTKWSTYASSDPVEDIEDAKATILENTGFLPNTFVLGYDVFRQLRNHPRIEDKFKYTSSQSITPELLAQVFGVERVLVSMAIKNTGDEGGTNTYDFTATQDAALLCYVNPNPGLLAPSAGYTFVWQGVSEAMGQDIGVSRFPMRERGKLMQRVEGEIAFDHKIVASDLGYFFSDAVD